MKKLVASMAIFIITISVFAQSPEKMSYQCVVRNASGLLVTNQSVGIRISILQGSASGSVVYQEIYNPNPQTNANGLLSIEIGGGLAITGTFSSINWATGMYFLKTETDPTGGTNYTIVGTSQLLSVPYAIYANSAGNGFSGNYNDLSNLPFLFSGNYADLTNKPVLFDGTWGSLIAKPSFATVASTGNYNDLLNRPTLFTGTWVDVAGKPSTLAGYGITDAMNTSHVANGITSTLIGNWNTAFNWGNHIGLYKPIGYVPAWTEILNKPSTLAGYGITDAVNITGNQIIGGNKTFTGTITVSTPVNSNDAANKAYVDELFDKIKQLEAEIGVTDIDDNHYKAVKIGTQIWMAEDLNTSRLNDGTPLTLILDDVPWCELLEPGYCRSSWEIFGAYYNWMAVDTKILCPIGWHVPSDAEWTILSEYLGGESVAGDKLKSTTTWRYHNTGTNESGFTALPSGFRAYLPNNTPGCNFSIDLNTTYWWTSTEVDEILAWHRRLDLLQFSRFNSNKRFGYSVRCVKNN